MKSDSETVTVKVTEELPESLRGIESAEGL